MAKLCSRSRCALSPPLYNTALPAENGCLFFVLIVVSFLFA
jgi:hypothetical protein